MVLDKTHESPLDSKEIKPVNPKGNNPEYLLEGLLLKLKRPILWSPDATIRLFGKDPEAGEDGRQKEKRAAEDKMLR